MDQRMCTKTS